MFNTYCNLGFLQSGKTVFTNERLVPNQNFGGVSVVMWNQRSKPWSLQLQCINAIHAIAYRSLKIKDFNGVWTCDLVIPVKCSNQLRHEVTDIGSWSFVGSNVKGYMKYCRCKIKKAMILAVMSIQCIMWNEIIPHFSPIHTFLWIQGSAFDKTKLIYLV